MKITRIDGQKPRKNLAARPAPSVPIPSAAKTVASAPPPAVPVNLFTLGLCVIEGRAGTNDLRQYLTTDRGDEVFRRKYPAVNFSLRLGVVTGDGAKMKKIPLGADLKEIFIVVREETLKNGFKRKVLYGWEEEEGWGVLGKETIRCVLAGKRTGPGESWALLEKPVPLHRLTQRQASKRDNLLTVKAVTRGLGNKVLKRWWTVYSSTYKDGRVRNFIQFKIGAKLHDVSGFDGYERVFSLIAEENGRIVGRFYADETAAEGGARPIKIVVFSKYIDGKWQPLASQEIMLTEPKYRRQFQRARALSLYEFITGSQKKGAVFILNRRRVHGHGSIHLKMHGELIRCGGYRKFIGQKLWGKVVVEGLVKRAYFYRNKEDLKANRAAIIEKGHVVGRAHKEKGALIWETALIKPSETLTRKLRETLNYEKYLFATKGDEVRICGWPASLEQGDEGGILVAGRNLLRQTMRLNLRSARADIKDVPTVTREFGRMIKMVEFYPDGDIRRAVQGQGKPSAVRWIAFHLINSDGRGRWIPFWHKLEDSLPFKELIETDQTTLHRLVPILTCDYLRDHYGREMAQILGQLGYYGR